MLNITIDKTVGILQVLTDKLSGINDKAKENTLLSQDYEDLNNKIDILSGMFNSNLNSNESDIVSLLNLPRPISEYTNEHIGEIIPIPYNDESGNITGPIEFEVVAVNHHKDVNDETKPTITLMSKNTIRYAAFDAKEPNSPLSDDMQEEYGRAEYGNNRWAVSNIRQWLNSEGAANEWFTPQHEYDTAPDTTNVGYDAAGAYANDPGFLVGFSQDIKSHFATVANTTWVYGTSTVDITNDKVFLASRTEMGYGDNNGILEGTHLTIRYPDSDSRIKQRNESNWYYWLRSASSSEPAWVIQVNDEGYELPDGAFCGTCDIVPLVVLI